MSKKSSLEVGGFIAHVATDAAGMLGAAVTGTGAYFTDSKAGGLRRNSLT